MQVDDKLVEKIAWALCDGAEHGCRCTKETGPCPSCVMQAEKVAAALREPDVD